jgi:hypothetical protein
MPLQRVRAMVREAVALSRNYRHAVILHQHLRRRYGAHLVTRPSILIGDALASMDHAPWRRLMILAVLVLIAFRGR